MSHQAATPFGAVGSASHKRMGALLAALRAEFADIRGRVLAEDVERISHALTRKRGSTVRGEYLSSPGARRAYFAHFFPWNIYRLLLAWDLSWPFENIEVPDPVIEDWGAGPLTALFAAWVREGNALRGTWRCWDREADVLAWGADLAKRLGVTDTITLETHAEDVNLQRHAVQLRPADLIVVANALNEWLPARGRSKRDMVAICKRFMAAIAAKGQLFVIEPANRVVSHGVMTLREEMVRAGFVIHAPCTHLRRCPLLDPRLRSWCHFRMPVTVHPEHEPLLAATGFRRQEISFSWLHGQIGVALPSEKRRVAVVMSDAMETGGGQWADAHADGGQWADAHAGGGQRRSIYACASEGRVVLEVKNDIPVQGSNVEYRIERPFKRDSRGSWKGRITRPRH